MNQLKTACLTACLAVSTILVGCSEKVTQSPSLTKNRNPKFLKDITLAGHSNGVVNTIGEMRNAMPSVDMNPTRVNVLQAKYGGLLRVLPQSLTNFPLYSFIDEWYGVRYRLGGSDKTGIDCSAFVKLLYNHVFHTDLLRTAFEQFQMCKMEWNVDSLKEGDLVFFRTHGKNISHVGIYLANNFFVHASSSRGVTISSLSEEYWSRYYAGAGQIQKGRG